MRSDHYTAADVSRLTGATISQIERFHREDAIFPASEAPRRGMSRAYTLQNVAEIKIALTLLECGVPMRAIRLVAQEIHGGWPMMGAEFKRRVLVIEHGEHSEAFGCFPARVYLRPEDASAWLSQGRSGVVIHIPQILAAVEAATGRSVLEDPELDKWMAAHGVAQ